MSSKPVAILERLLTQEAGLRNAQYLKSSRYFFDAGWAYEEVQSIEAEFAHEFRAIAGEVEEAWGPPDFIGRRGASGFPDFYAPEELCYWRRGDVLAIIWWEHQDKELPVLLALAVVQRFELGKGGTS